LINEYVEYTTFLEVAEQMRKEYGSIKRKMILIEALMTAELRT